jgi:hypothetical protein
LPVSDDKVFFYLRGKEVSGYALGLPELATSNRWFRLYANLLLYHSSFARSLFSLPLKFTAKTKTAAANAASELAKQPLDGSSKAAALTEDMAIQAISSQGLTVPTTNWLGILAAGSAAANLPVTLLATDVGRTGTGQGANSTLSNENYSYYRLKLNKFKELFENIARYIYGSEVSFLFADIVRNSPDTEIKALDTALKNGLVWQDEAYKKAHTILAIQDTHAEEVPPLEEFIKFNTNGYSDELVEK